MNFRPGHSSIRSILVVVSILSYGLLIPFTGFFWDDWPFAWIAHFLGPAEFFPAFEPFRPFLAPIFYLTTSLLPENPLAWQAFGVLIRFLTGLSAWWALDNVWPNHKRQTLTAAMLFLVFPGYSQQWVALTHVNQELIPLIFYLLSFGLTARAIRSRSRFHALTALALLLHICGLFPTEYFFGLEAMRFFFIWTLLPENERGAVEVAKGFRTRLIYTFKLWFPYLLVWVANAAWLFYYYTFGPYNSYGIDLETPSSSLAILQILPAMGEAVYKAGFLAWVQIFAHLAEDPTAPSSLLAIALILLTFILIAFYFLRFTSSSSTSSSWLRIALITGLIGILFGRLPSWAANLPLTLQSSYDRFMVSMMLGAALFIAGMLELIRNERVRAILASALVALSVGQQFLNANIFRRDWEGQRAIYWQMAWRIPALRPGTLLLTHEMPLDYETDLSMTAPINWMYAPDYQPPDDVPYALAYTEKRLGGRALPDLEPGAPVIFPIRTVAFRGATDAALVIFVPREGCLRVLDSVYANETVYGRQPDFLTDAIPLSDPTRILVDAPAPEMPAALFGAEPAHEWCYFYAKAELARQKGDWATVAALGEEAERLGFAPADPFEWLPFIEAYARTGAAQTAEELSRAAFAEDAGIRRGLCQLWERVGDGAQAEVRARAEGLLSEFGCH
ncbi:MAG: hypothetical protein AB1554_17415 [Chloroflexota bacterium]